MPGRVGNRLPEMLWARRRNPRQASVYDSAVLTHFMRQVPPSVAGLQAAVRDNPKTRHGCCLVGGDCRVLEWCSHRSHLTAQVLPVIDFARFTDYALAGSGQRVLDDRQGSTERFPRGADTPLVQETSRIPGPHGTIQLT